MERDIYHSAFDTPYQHPGNYSLTHHGILGMKWGVWNEETARRYGSSGDRKSAGPMASSKNTSGSVPIGNVRSFITQALLAVPNHMTGGLLGVGLNLSEQLRSLKKIEAERAQGLESKNVEFSKKEKELTPEKDRALVNARYDGIRAGYSTNCSNCTLAYEMRRRGFDVIARPLWGGRTEYDIHKFFGNPKVHKLGDPSTRTTRSGKEFPMVDARSMLETMTAKLAKDPDGSRGAVTYKHRDSMSGHILNYEKKDGQIKFVDAQNSWRTTKAGALNSAEWGSVTFFRTDNAAIDMSLAHNAVEDRKSLR